MAAEFEEIPLIDFSKFSLDVKEENVSTEEMGKLADELCDAFKNVGFVYLRNCGITQTEVRISLLSLLHRYATTIFKL